MSFLEQMSRKELRQVIEDFAKNWLAHDGLWFQAVEQAFGLDKAIELDAEAWRGFAPIEARRIKARLGLPEKGGLDALEIALGHRLYAVLNRQTVEREEDKLLFHMNECRVQQARKRKDLPDFPCKSVGLVEFTEFAKAIDPRIQTRCISCPPDGHPAHFYCGWEFNLVSSE